MTTHSSTDQGVSTRAFYLPALPALSGGRLEGLLLAANARHRRFLRRLE